MEQFEVGDTVQLKSGGPIMTVIEVTAAGWVACRWYDGKQSKTEDFPSGSLVSDEGGIGVA